MDFYENVTILKNVATNLPPCGQHFCSHQRPCYNRIYAIPEYVTTNVDCILPIVRFPYWSEHRIRTIHTLSRIDVITLSETVQEVCDCLRGLLPWSRLWQMTAYSLDQPSKYLIWHPRIAPSRSYRLLRCCRAWRGRRVLIIGVGTMLWEREQLKATPSQLNTSLTTATFIRCYFFQILQCFFSVLRNTVIYLF